MNGSLPDQNSQPKKRLPTWTFAGFLVFSLMITFGLVYFAASGEPGERTDEKTLFQGTQLAQTTDIQQIQLPATYQLNVSYDDLGPQILAADAIDYERFSLLYENMGQPLTPLQQSILTKGSDAPIVFDNANAHFLLNFFWAFGLVNHNPILTEGLMMQYGQEGVGNFASTGGWSLGKRPATELYASAYIIPLTSMQQARLEEVSSHVYRPCCNNHTAFPDCNHGMAMLGLLTLMAGNGASVDEMFEAAKYVNAFWFPQQTYETAVYFKADLGLDYEDVFPSLAVGVDKFSASGFQNTHQWLVQNNVLPGTQSGGNSCSVS